MKTHPVRRNLVKQDALHFCQSKRPDIRKLVSHKDLSFGGLWWSSGEILSHKNLLLLFSERR